MSQTDGCDDHSQPGTFRRAVIQSLAWLITHVLARGYRVAVIAPCVDRIYAESLVRAAAASAKPAPNHTDHGQYV